MRSCKLPALQSPLGNELLGNALDGSTIKENTGKYIIYLHLGLVSGHGGKLSKWKIIKHDAVKPEWRFSCHLESGHWRESPRCFLDKSLEGKGELQAWLVSSQIISQTQYINSCKAFCLPKGMRLAPSGNYLGTDKMAQWIELLLS